MIKTMRMKQAGQEKRNTLMDWVENRETDKPLEIPSSR
jgi:hypothetical protein